MPFRELEALLAGGRESPPPARHRVLIVDDDAGMRSSLELLLGDRYQLTVCASAEEGVEAMRDDICAVVLDVKMHGHDGFWACQQIRKKAETVPVIFYSGYQNLKDPFVIMNEYRPFAFLTKGDDIKRLLDALETAVSLQAKNIADQRLIESLEPTQHDAT